MKRRHRHYRPPPPGGEPPEDPPPDLFGPPPPPPPPEHDGRARHTDPDTSHKAARKARTGRVDLLMLRALAESRLPLRYGQVAQITGEREVVVSPRFRQLEKRGCVQRVGKEINPDTGAEGTTWGITDYGRAAVNANDA